MPDAADPEASAELASGFLTDRAIDAGGRVLSWIDPDCTGYPYPEIGGYMLSWLAQHAPLERALEVGRPVMTWLGRAQRADGGFGRDGATYTFDSAVVLRGASEWSRATGAAPSLDVRACLDAVARGLGHERARYPEDEKSPSDHWSQSFGAHLLKLELCLSRTARARPELLPPISVAREPLESLRRLQGTDGRFVDHADTDATYLHAHAYAVEGLVGLGREARDRALDGARWLASVQQADGGLLARHDGRRAFGAPHVDATAQAVRLWGVLDRREFAEPARRALAWLRDLQTPDGSLPYEPEHPHRNTWCTLFAHQAFTVWALAADADADASVDPI